MTTILNAAEWMNKVQDFCKYAKIDFSSINYSIAKFDKTGIDEITVLTIETPYPKLKAHDFRLANIATELMAAYRTDIVPTFNGSLILIQI